MCTAITYHTSDHYFGRNLDYEQSFGEAITVTPRNYEFAFPKVYNLKKHYAIIGMAKIENNYPLYYDATNEKGLSMAGLLFAGNAEYKEETEGKDNIASFEFIPWILGQCATVSEARILLKRINIDNRNFEQDLPSTPLHWIIADRKECLVIECVKEGMKKYDNPMGVLTNNPPFDMQLFNLNNYLSLSCKMPQNSFSNQIDLQPYSRGMGALGMPGDLSSMSRFVRAAFIKLNSKSGNTEFESISQFLHILDAVSQQRGCVLVDGNQYEITRYSSCCNIDKGIYYYKTYENSQISAVELYKEDLDGKNLSSYSLKNEQNVFMQN